MTLASPNCPVAYSLPHQVEEAVGAVEGVTDATVEIVWDPPRDPTKMSDHARLELGTM